MQFDPAWADTAYFEKNSVQIGRPPLSWNTRFLPTRGDAGVVITCVPAQRRSATLNRVRFLLLEVWPARPRPDRLHNIFLQRTLAGSVASLERRNQLACRLLFFKLL